MTREELIEVMARAMHDGCGTYNYKWDDLKAFDPESSRERGSNRQTFYQNAKAALAALEAAGVRLVPVNATLEMKDKGSRAGLHAAGQPAQDIYGSIFRAMIAASPYATDGG